MFLRDDKGVISISHTTMYVYMKKLRREKETHLKLERKRRDLTKNLNLKTVFRRLDLCGKEK